jgi:nitrogen fixation-related uncharacterized protein
MSDAPSDPAGSQRVRAASTAAGRWLLPASLLLIGVGIVSFIGAINTSQNVDLARCNGSESTPTAGRLLLLSAAAFIGAAVMLARQPANSWRRSDARIAAACLVAFIAIVALFWAVVGEFGYNACAD